jgi:pimeloyl-ACP methyl ester carboxylesterase
MKKIIYVFFIFVFIPASLYTALNRENMDVKDFRINSGYKEVMLSDGITAYKDIGSKDSEVIVLVHGATFGSLAYEEYVNVFLENNYRVITYDQYGRGYSDRVVNDVNIELMERQLQELIEYCQAENVILYGVSFGAAIVAKYASNNPDNISFIGYQVPLIDSANVPLLSLIKIPLYGDLLSRALFIPTVLKRIKDYEHLMSKKLMDHYLDQFKVKGTEKFFKEFFIGNAMGNRMDNHDVIGNNDIPSYFAYAEDDLEIDSLLVKQAIGKYNNPIVKKYLGGHFFSSGIEKQVAKDFIDSIEKY